MPILQTNYNPDEMITIKVDLVKYGIMDPQPLKEIIISNDGTGDTFIGNYKYRIKDSRGKVYREGRIEGFRRRSKDVLYLLGLVLENENYIQTIQPVQRGESGFDVTQWEES